jgi:hypothetical protein
MRKFLLLAGLGLAPATLLTGFASSAFAQTSVSGDIAGMVTDPTGAAIPNATVTVQNIGTAATKTSKSDSSGAYRASLLPPGSYKVTASAAGFNTVSEVVNVNQGNVTSGDLKLAVGNNSTTIEVAASEEPLLQTEDAQVSTTFNLQQVQTLPNPGGDITYYAQTTPGVVMNTGGGYGNFSVFGLPGTSNNFMVNGFQENDPFLNLNNSGPTNLLLGQNDIESVNVVATAYGAEFGSFGGVQESMITRSGTNKFHGNVSYWWNGSDLNANDFFLNTDGVSRPFTNANQWAAGIGGPIVKDKTFFFADYEGLRFITAPLDLNYIPSPAYESSVVGTGAAGSACGAGASLVANGQAAECGYYNNIFSLFNNAPGAANATAVTGDPYAVQFYSSPKIFAKEELVTFRLDQKFSDKDTVFAHYKYDNGTQPTASDPINSAFSDVSYQPEDEGQIVWTHVFSPNITNQLNLGVAHYGAYFQSVNQAAANALFPGTLIVIDPVGDELTSLGGINYLFPEGRNATQYSISEDFSWEKGKHTLKFGYAFKKDDISDFDPEILRNPLQVSDDTQGYFSAGADYYYEQAFPNNFSEPVGLYSEGFYAQDSYKAASNLLLSVGVRVEHNSNAISSTNDFSRLNGSFASVAAANTLDTPYNSAVAAGQHTIFNSFQAAAIEPRVEAVYSPFGPDGKTVIRGGFGMFSDVFPGQVADDALSNIPQAPTFLVYGAPIDPAVTNSSSDLASAAATGFKSGASNFYNGASYNSLNAELAAGFTAPNITTSEPAIKYPTYEEYSLQIEQAINKNTSFEIGYAGNHGYHEPVVNGNANGYNPAYGMPSTLVGPAGAFSGVAAAAPAPSFGTVTDISSNASSNYNGLLISVIHRSKWVNAQLNYTWSHAMDDISNGGFLGFSTSSITNPLSTSTLAYNYGNSDYDIRNSLNGNYLVRIPGYHRLKAVTEGWTVAGTVFYRSGLPFTVVDSAITDDLAYFSGSVPAQVVNTSISHHCGRNGVADYQHPTATCLTLSDFTDPTGLIPGQRNAFNGPHFFDTDMTINKAFFLPHHEAQKLVVGAVFYNLLNHPNFSNPISDINNSEFGEELTTVGPPTSIYGSGLGGDASTRIIQLNAKVTF